MMKIKKFKISYQMKIKVPMNLKLNKMMMKSS
jgi:hypothetical protein